jgi:hypothetical protein
VVNLMGCSLGEMVKDKVTGFTGMVMARTEYLNGCVQVLVQPKGCDKEGKPKESVWMDEQRFTAHSNAKAGGPQPTPPLLPTR